MKDGSEISKVSDLFRCSSKSFLNLRLSSTRFLINPFLIKNVLYKLLLHIDMDISFQWACSFVINLLNRGLLLFFLQYCTFVSKRVAYKQVVPDCSKNRES